MKPVDQTLFGKVDGNCLPACIASLLEIGIEEVPHFCRDYRDSWFRAFLNWLEPKGLTAICWLGPGWPEGYAEHLRKLTHIAGGPSPRYEGNDVLHAVVMRGDELLHDPHHDRRGIRSVEDRIFIFATEFSSSREAFKREVQGEWL